MLCRSHGVGRTAFWPAILCVAQLPLTWQSDFSTLIRASRRASLLRSYCCNASSITPEVLIMSYRLAGKLQWQCLIMLLVNGGILSLHPSLWVRTSLLCFATDISSWSWTQSNTAMCCCLNVGPASVTSLGFKVKGTHTSMACSSAEVQGD